MFEILGDPQGGQPPFSIQPGACFAGSHQLEPDENGVRDVSQSSGAGKKKKGPPFSWQNLANVSPFPRCHARGRARARSATLRDPCEVPCWRERGYMETRSEIKRSKGKAGTGGLGIER